VKKLNSNILLDRKEIIQKGRYTAIVREIKRALSKQDLGEEISELFRNGDHLEVHLISRDDIGKLEVVFFSNS